MLCSCTRCASGVLLFYAYAIALQDDVLCILRLLTRAMTLFVRSGSF